MKKYPPLSDYLKLIKSASDKQDDNKAKRYGETALKKLPRLAYAPFEEYLLYARLGNTYSKIGEYSNSLNAFYKADLIASKNNLGPEYIAYTSYMIGGVFHFYRSPDQALPQFQKVKEYYAKFGNDKYPMDKEKQFNTFIFEGFSYLYKNNTDAVKEIIEKKISHLLPSINKQNLFIRNYHALQGQYFIKAKQYDKAIESVNKSLEISRQAGFTRGILEADIHIAVINLFQHNLQGAIKILTSLIKEAQRLKFNEYICRIGLVLSKCYALNNNPAKSRLIESKIKNILNKLDTTWLYEQTREFEELYRELQPIYRQSAFDQPVPKVLSDTINRQNRNTEYKNIIVGNSAPIMEIHQLIEKTAPTDLSILIQGETGTGKELIARAIHNRSVRRDKKWLAINCGAMPETLLENELFGHAKGAFTDAHSDKKGLIEITSEGTLFLDEIADMSANMQQKLLRVLEEKSVWRLGGEKTVPVNTRFIFASNKDIEQSVRKKLFRNDFYYRINTIVIKLPPLRERKEDIPPLVEHFLAKYSGHKTPNTERLTPNALALLQGYPWPGNIRELENEIKRICTLYSHIIQITEKHLSESITKHGNSGNLKSETKMSINEMKDEFEKNIIIEALTKYKGNISQVARSLKYPRRQLYRKITQFDIQPDKYVTQK